jgi:hypothetical protein
MKLMFTETIGCYLKRVHLSHLFNKGLSNLDNLASNFGLKHCALVSHIMKFIMYQNLLSSNSKLSVVKLFYSSKNTRWCKNHLTLDVGEDPVSDTDAKR